MVKISELYWTKGKLNISIQMNPCPDKSESGYFYVESCNNNATINIDNGSILTGLLEPIIYKEVFCWWEANKELLINNWNKCLKNQFPAQIDGKVE